jgi:hypothetical protein
VIVETKLPEVVQTQSYPQNIIVVTDASVHQNQAAIAWVITDSQGEILHKFKQRLKENGISSFRAEAYGVCSALTTLHSSQTIQYSRWKLYCDNKALIQRLLSLQQKKFNSEWIDSDILKVISDHIPPNGSFHHVKGHQVITEQSPLEAWLNDFVDKLANLAIQEVPQEFTLSNTIQIRGGEKLLFGTPKIIQYCRERLSEDFWKQRFGLSTHSIIDWKIYNAICLHFKNQVSILKLLNGLTPTRSRLFKLNLQQSSLCPLCSQVPEDFHHVLFCSKNPACLMQNTHIFKKLLK